MQPQLSSCSLTTLSLNRFVYYLSKYWELLDSLFQLQKARSLGYSPPGFLHYFHHAAVMVLLLAHSLGNHNRKTLRNVTHVCFRSCA